MRWNLKEVGGKPPVRGTRISYNSSIRWVSLLNKIKPLLPKANESKMDGGEDKALTWGDLTFCKQQC
ncbi:hypothetical protein [Brevibacillus daliensis]|uniref:hypothetical protein n=1 Tax=Brevibacillus daliensis TaxID=2892995 RepID=UPI001E4ED4BB|nr:hypothetical protein [Brevibacillus daliensis]